MTDQEFDGFIAPVYLTNTSKEFLELSSALGPGLAAKIFPQVTAALSIEQRRENERKREIRRAAWKPPQDWLNLLEWVKVQPEGPAVTALAGVLALHVPVDRMYEHDLEWNSCRGCDAGSYAEDDPDWPCSTIRMIAKALHYELKETD